MADSKDKSKGLAPGPALAFVAGVVNRTEAQEPAELLEALVRIRELREQLSRWEPQLIEAARAGGVSWGELAPSLGVASRQAAERRYLRISPNAADPAMNHEERVQAARDQRASDRAVVAWAHDNAAHLRRLAGEVTSLGDLGNAVQASVDRVNVALGSSDSAALLDPLADAGRQLVRDHPALAARLSDIRTSTDEARETSRLRLTAAEPGGQAKLEGN